LYQSSNGDDMRLDKVRLGIGASTDWALCVMGDTTKKNELSQIFEHG